MSMQKPNLFVVGAMRSGTTAFMDLLAQHPEIYTAPIKEPHHFVSTLPSEIFEPQPHFSMKTYLAKEFPKPTHRAHVTHREDYEALFSLSSTEAYRAEGSVSYLHAPEVASKIADYQSAAKIIILLRDPIERLVSHYRMDVGLLREKRSLNEVIENQLTLYRNGKLPWYSHLGMSMYNDAVDTYKIEFGDQVLVLTSRSLFSNPDLAMKQVASFLKIEPFENTLITRRNESRSHRFPKLFAFLKSSRIFNRIKRGIPTNVRRKLWRSLSSSEIPSSKLSAAHLKELQAIFKKESNIKT